MSELRLVCDDPPMDEYEGKVIALPRPSESWRWGIAALCSATLCVSLAVCIGLIVWNDAIDRPRTVPSGLVWVTGMLIIAVCIPLLKISWNMRWPRSSPPL